MMNLLFPSVCLHCYQSIEKNSGQFCALCLSEFEFIDPRYRCHYCFQELENLRKRVCQVCQKKRHPLHRQAAVFDPSGPILTLSSHLRSMGKAYLTKGASAFLATQFLDLHWPKPDFISPTPLSLSQKIRQGFSHHNLMAQNLSKILKIPVFKYSKVSHEKLRGCTVLLIADRLFSNSPMEHYAEKMLAAHPAKIFGLALMTYPNAINS